MSDSNEQSEPNQHEHLSNGSHAHHMPSLSQSLNQQQLNYGYQPMRSNEDESINHQAYSFDLSNPNFAMSNMPNTYHHVSQSFGQPNRPNELGQSPSAPHHMQQHYQQHQQHDQSEMPGFLVTGGFPYLSGHLLQNQMQPISRPNASVVPTSQVLVAQAIASPVNNNHSHRKKRFSHNEDKLRRYFEVYNRLIALRHRADFSEELINQTFTREDLQCAASMNEISYYGLAKCPLAAALIRMLQNNQMIIPIDAYGSMLAPADLGSDGVPLLPPHASELSATLPVLANQVPNSDVLLGVPTVIPEAQMSLETRSKRSGPRVRGKTWQHSAEKAQLYRDLYDKCASVSWMELEVKSKLTHQEFRTMASINQFKYFGIKKEALANDLWSHLIQPQKLITPDEYEAKHASEIERSRADMKTPIKRRSSAVENEVRRAIADSEGSQDDDMHLHNMDDHVEALQPGVPDETVEHAPPGNLLLNGMGHKFELSKERVMQYAQVFVKLDNDWSEHNLVSKLTIPELQTAAIAHDINAGFSQSDLIGHLTATAHENKILTPEQYDAKLNTTLINTPSGQSRKRHRESGVGSVGDMSDVSDTPDVRHTVRRRITGSGRHGSASRSVHRRQNWEVLEERTRRYADIYTKLHSVDWSTLSESTIGYLFTRDELNTVLSLHDDLVPSKGQTKDVMAASMFMLIKNNQLSVPAGARPFIIHKSMLLGAAAEVIGQAHGVPLAAPVTVDALSVSAQPSVQLATAVTLSTQSKGKWEHTEDKAQQYTDLYNRMVTYNWADDLIRMKLTHSELRTIASIHEVKYYGVKKEELAADIISLIRANSLIQPDNYRTQHAASIAASRVRGAKRRRRQRSSLGDADLEDDDVGTDYESESEHAADLLDVKRASVSRRRRERPLTSLTSPPSTEGFAVMRLADEERIEHYAKLYGRLAQWDWQTFTSATLDDACTAADLKVIALSNNVNVNNASKSELVEIVLTILSSSQLAAPDSAYAAKQEVNGQNMNAVTSAAVSDEAGVSHMVPDVQR